MQLQLLSKVTVGSRCRYLLRLLTYYKQLPYLTSWRRCVERQNQISFSLFNYPDFSTICLLGSIDLSLSLSFSLTIASALPHLPSNFALFSFSLSFSCGTTLLQNYKSLLNLLNLICLSHFLSLSFPSTLFLLFCVFEKQVGIRVIRNENIFSFLSTSRNCFPNSGISLLLFPSYNSYTIATPLFSLSLSTHQYIVNNLHR